MPRVAATNPVDGQQGLWRNAVVAFWFDQPLDPASISSAAIEVTSHEVRQSGVIHYDPIQWRLTYAPRGLFRRDLAYDAVIEHDRLRCLRYGLPVEEASVTFVTGYDSVEITPDIPVSFDEEILPIFEGRCAFSGCHAGPGPAASLDLAGASRVSSTAIARRTTRGWPGWPRIDPGSAGWSYLFYKISEEPTIIGRAMPPGSGLDPVDVVTIVRWIDQGAKVDPTGDDS